MKPARPPKHVKLRRCESSGKVAHRTRNGAEVAIRRIVQSRSYDGLPISAYRCPEHPGEWLIGHTPRWKRSA